MTLVPSSDGVNYVWKEKTMFLGNLLRNCLVQSFLGPCWLSPYKVCSIHSEPQCFFRLWTGYPPPPSSLFIHVRCQEQFQVLGCTHETLIPLRLKQFNLLLRNANLSFSLFHCWLIITSLYVSALGGRPHSFLPMVSENSVPLKTV